MEVGRGQFWFSHVCVVGRRSVDLGVVYREGERADLPAQLQANLEQLIKISFKPQPTPSTTTTDDLTVPITTCPIYLRIQPVLAPLPYLPRPSSTTNSDDKDSNPKALFFLLLLRDPTHNLAHESLSQSIPAAWLDIPFEENEWVEDVMVEVIRRSVE